MVFSHYQLDLHSNPATVAGYDPSWFPGTQKS